MDPNVEQHRIQFYQEARDILDRVNDDILKVEADPENQEILNSIFRGVHTIKGSAGAFDMDDVSQFTHHLEGILNALREGRLVLTPDLVDVALAGSDHIHKMIDDYASGRKASINDELVAAFRSFLSKVSEQRPEVDAVCTCAVTEAASRKAPSGRLFPEEVGHSLADAALKGLNAFKVTLRYTSEMMEHGYDPMVLLRNLRHASTYYHSVTPAGSIPLLHEMEPLSLYLHPVVYVATESTREEIELLTFDPSLVMVEALQAGGEEAAAGDADGPADTIDPDAFKEFLAGATEMLEALEKAVILYEETNSRDALNQIFRLVHNLKGDSDYVGFRELTAFAHALESLLDRLRMGTAPRTPETVDLILQAVDFLKQSILRITRKKDIGPSPAIFSRIEKLLQQPSSATRESTVPLPQISNELEGVFIEQALQFKEVLTTVAASMPLDATRKRMVQRSLNGLLQGSKLLNLKTLEQTATRAVSALAGQEGRLLVEAVEEVIAFIEGLEEEPKRIGELLVRDGKITEKDLKDALSRQKRVGRILVEEGKVSEEDVQKALKKQSLMETARQLRPAAAEPEMRTMRIDERKVEHFNNIIGELLIARNTYEYLVHYMGGADDELRSTVKQLKENLHLISRLTNEMHHGVMSLRMVPIRNIFQKFSRVARDISRKQHKSIDLITDGEEIEIDKKVADMLTDPLVHIVRNACDHAIEQPEERKSAGKPEKGTVILRASQEGRNLTIRIIDDGKGIDRPRLYEKAKEAGMDVPSSLDDPSLLELIFAPGLSTKSEVTDISGRGVGMDVVKTTTQALGGTVQVTSEEGKGTEIVLSLPMAIGISAALLVEADQCPYAIPLDYIMETLKLPAHKLRKATGSGLVFYYREEVLPAERLDVLLGAASNRNGGGAHRNVRDREEGINAEVAVVVVKTTFGKFGLIVDRLDKNMELAIKPVPGSLASIDVISGVSIMGDGRILLVLNPEKLF